MTTKVTGRKAGISAPRKAKARPLSFPPSSMQKASSATPRQAKASSRSASNLPRRMKAIVPVPDKVMDLSPSSPSHTRREMAKNVEPTAASFQQPSMATQPRRMKTCTIMPEMATLEPFSPPPPIRRTKTDRASPLQATRRLSSTAIPTRRVKTKTGSSKTETEMATSSASSQLQSEEALDVVSIRTSETLPLQVASLEVFAVNRRQAVTAMTKVTNQLKSFVRRLWAQAGEPLGLKEEVTNKHIQRFETHAVVLQLTAISKELEEWRTREEKCMCKAVEGMPALDSFWKPTHGLGILGFALVVSEAGLVDAQSLCTYQNKGQLWRRFGLAPINGKACSTWKRTGGLSSEDWEAVGYCPRRRSVMYNIVDSLLRQGEKTPHYYSLYLKYKNDEVLKAKAAGLTVAPAAAIPTDDKDSYMSLGHIDMRARRKIAKQVLKDLWKVWRSETTRAQPQGFPSSVSSSPS